MRVFVQGLLGLLFGLGLILSGIADPSRLPGFLDVAAIRTSGWDPGLVLVVLAAVFVTFLGYRLVLQWPQPLLDHRFHLPPSRSTMDVPIVLGPAAFGVGWALAGLCPGAAFTALGSGHPGALLFVTSMLVGMGGARHWIRRGSSSRRDT